MSIQVLGDPNNQKFCSSDIIISNLNNAAKNLGIYSENGYKVVYDCIGNAHGYNPDAMIIVYELIFPSFILNKVYPKPIFGVSRDNLQFILEGGYPIGLSDYVHLGVDATIWEYRQKEKRGTTFRLLGIGESNTRGGLELVVSNFCEEFTNEKGIELYLRDRSATDIFKTWVQEQAKKYNVHIIHDDRHLENFEEEKEILYSADAAICLNKSSTWNLRTIECMSVGTPLIVIPYAGPKDYSVDNESAMHVKYELSPITIGTLNYLQDIGLKNYLFTPTMHPRTPVWSVPINTSVREKMRQVIDDNAIRLKIATDGSEYVKQFTWENSINALYTKMKKYKEVIS